MLFRVLKRLNFNGTLEIIDSKNHKHKFGTSNPIITIRLINKSIEEILSGLDMENKAVRNNGGGFYNHLLFWKIMSPNGGGIPSGALAEAIDNKFGSFEEFKTTFSKAAATQFGSGWNWLSIYNGKLVVNKTPNAENTLIHNMKPILGCDLWEHSYYVDYKNRRPEYLENFFEKLINWEFVESNLD